jgi:hypothetical protein
MLKEAVAMLKEVTLEQREAISRFFQPTACSVGWWLIAGAGLF